MKKDIDVSIEISYYTGTGKKFYSVGYTGKDFGGGSPCDTKEEVMRQLSLLKSAYKINSFIDKSELNLKLGNIENKSLEEFL
jgi:hypothetical protein